MFLPVIVDKLDNRWAIKMAQVVPRTGLKDALQTRLHRTCTRRSTFQLRIILAPICKQTGNRGVRIGGNVGISEQLRQSGMLFGSRLCCLRLCRHRYVGGPFS